MKRREFMTLLGGATVVYSLSAYAQQARRIAVLMGIAEGDPEAKARLDALRQGLASLGWKEGENVHLEYRFADGRMDRVLAYAEEFVRMSPDVIVANSAPAVAALSAATRTIPIVFAQVADPVEAGLVASLANPGGNITGFTQFEPSIGEKWLQTLKEIAPAVTRVGLLGNSQNPIWSKSLAAIRTVAPLLRAEVIPLSAVKLEEIEHNIEQFSREANGGLIVLTDIINTVNRDRIIALAATHRLPAIYPYRYWALSGGLASYGIDNLNLYRGAASYIDRIFKGASPADLPVQTPTRFDLIINLKTAEALGLTVPPTLLARADEVIE
jgi:putative tryptophan/tyrosine transport system substrate-binding protein